MVQVLGEGRENRKGSIGEKRKQRYERGAKDGEGGSPLSVYRVRRLVGRVKEVGMR